MAQQDRIKFISFLQILGVTLVVLGHSLHEYPINHGGSTLFYRLFQTIRMPLFVFISGFLFNYSRVKSGRLKPYGEFVKGKIQRLIIPFLFLGTITFLPRTLLSGYADDSMELSIENFFYSFIFSDKLVIVYFWFLPAIFILLNLVYGGLKLFKQHELALYIIMISIGLTLNYFIHPEHIRFLAIGHALNLLIFFVLGVAYAEYSNKLNLYFNSPATLTLTTAAWLGLFFIPSDLYVFRILCNITGLGMCISLSLVIGLKCNWLMHLEGYTYIIYLLSWYTCIASQQVLHHFTDFSWYVYTCIAFLSSIYIPFSIGKLLYHFAPHSKAARLGLWLLGHNPNRHKKIT